MTRRIQGHDDVPALMTDVCGALAPALSSSGVAWREWQADDDDAVSRSDGLVVARGGRWRQW